MMRDIARLNFEGKLQAVAEVEGQPTQTLHFGNWDAVVSYGLAGRGAAKGNPSRSGAPWSLNSRTIQFLVTGYALPRRLPPRRHRAAAQVRSRS
jgi:hypothetical protein